jgi:hypothetical protein
MREIKVRATEDKIIFTVNEEDAFYITLPRFFDIIRRDGETIRNEAEARARRFDPIKRLETIAGIDVLLGKGLSLAEIAGWIHFPEGLLREFLSTEGNYLSAVRSDPSYKPVYDGLKADPVRIGDGGPLRSSRQPRPPEPPAPPARPSRPSKGLFPGQ